MGSVIIFAQLINKSIKPLLRQVTELPLFFEKGDIITIKDWPIEQTAHWSLDQPTNFITYKLEIKSIKYLTSEDKKILNDADVLVIVKVISKAGL